MSENSIHPATTLGHVQITVRHLKRALVFYQDVIGLQLFARNGNVARLGAGETEILALKENPDARVTPRTTGLYHFAILTPSRLALAHSLKRLADTETPVTGFADHHVSEAIYLNDPEGNGIEIYRDRPREQWTDVRGNFKITTDPIDLDGILTELRDQDQTWRGMDPATRLGHMHLRVADTRTADAFYVDVLGFDVMIKLAQSASFVSAGGYHHHLGYNIWESRNAPPPPRDATGLDYFVVQLPNRDELARVTNRVRDAGIEMEETEEGLLARDPSQNGIVLHAEEKN